MNTTFISFCINRKHYLASQILTTTATWKVYKIYPDKTDLEKKRLTFVAEITCNSNNIEKIKAAFLAVDECPYCRRLIPENDAECTCEYDAGGNLSVFCDSECQSYYHVFGRKSTN